MKGRGKCPRANVIITPPLIGNVEYCNERVCLSVRVCVCLSTITIISPELHVRYDLHQFFVRVTYGRGSVLLRRRSYIFLLWRRMLHISGFVDNVIFAHKLIGCSTSPPG